MISHCAFLLIFVTLANFAYCQRTGDNVQYRPNTCLIGDKHITRPHPEPEDNTYQACHQWRDGACCTPEFTQQLSEHTTVNSIDGFHWNRCGNFSQRCRQFFIQIECFYRCSPNIAHFANTQFPSALANLPLCGDYCDNWYEACKDEMTCAVDWTRDWVYNATTGENHCRNDTCKRYSDVYGSGRGICERLWGRSFFYSNYSSTDPDETRECLLPSFPLNATNPNTVVIERFFGLNGCGLLIPSSLLLVILSLATIMNLL